MSVRSAVVQAPALARRALKPSAKASSSSTPSGRSYGSAAAAAGGGRRPLASCPPQQAARSGAASQKRAFHSSNPARAAAKDPYKVLGVDRKAAIGDIKKSYYQLAKKYHPDQNKEAGSKEKFVEIQAAYDTLSDDKKRAAYDTYGSASQDGNFDPSGGSPFGSAGFGGFHDFSSAFGSRGGPTGDLFESLFGGLGGGMGGRAGGGGGPQRPAKGDDLESAVTIDFLEACQGTTRSVTTHPVTDCGPCKGSGLKSGAKRTECKGCGGTGVKTFMIQSGFRMQSACNQCAGAGSTIPTGKECGTCGGLGKVKEKKVQTVTIPAGVDDGLLLRMPGAGDLPLSGPGSAGDLLIRIGVRPSNDYRRQGTTLFYTAKIPVHVALLGGKTTVPTLEGEVDIKVKPGTQFGDQIVLSGRGVTSAMVRERKRGDLIVEYQLEIPRSLTAEQRFLLEKYASTVKASARSAYSTSDGGYSGGAAAASASSADKTKETPSASSSSTTASSSSPAAGTDNEPAPSPSSASASEPTSKESPSSTSASGAPPASEKSTTAEANV